MLRGGANYLVGSWHRNRRLVVREKQIDGMISSRYFLPATWLIGGQEIQEHIKNPGCGGSTVQICKGFSWAEEVSSEEIGGRNIYIFGTNNR